MPVLYKVLDEIEKLSIEDKLFLEEEIHKRNIEIRRELLLEEVKESQKDYKQGEYKSFSTAEDFLMDIESDN